ncbi:hypothetical protein AAG906_021235 [Vitis piasezkii]
MSCDACKLGKIHQESFPSIAIKTNKPLQLIHSDVWGPSPNISIEDFSLANRLGRNLGSYYLFLKIRTLFRYSCPYTHQQQGRVEFASLPFYPVTSTIVPIVDNIVSTTCTHVVQPIIATMSQPLHHTSTNIHSMRQCLKVAFTNLRFTAIVVLLDHFQEPLVFRQALQLPHRKITMEAKYSTFVHNGFQQHANVDFSDTFTPIVKAPTIRIIFSLFDINNAFLNGILHEDAYMCQPEGFVIALVSWGFQSSISIISYFALEEWSFGFGITLTFRFALKTLVSISYFLRFEAFRDSSDLYLNQSKYISDLLVKKNMVHAKPSSTPMALGQKVALEDSAPFPDVTLYHSTICALQYLTLTRPDISFSACNVDDVRSTTDYCVFLGGNLVTQVLAKNRLLQGPDESKYWVWLVLLWN